MYSASTGEVNYYKILVPRSREGLIMARNIVPRLYLILT
jgi:hypothetical protein